MRMLTFASRALVLGGARTLEPIIHFRARPSISTWVRLAFIFFCEIGR